MYAPQEAERSEVRRSNVQNPAPEIQKEGKCADYYVI